MNLNILNYALYFRKWLLRYCLDQPGSSDDAFVARVIFKFQKMFFLDAF